MSRDKAHDNTIQAAVNAAYKKALEHAINEANATRVQAAVAAKEAFTQACEDAAEKARNAAYCTAERLYTEAVHKQAQDAVCIAVRENDA